MVWAAFITFMVMLFRFNRYRNLRKVSWLLGCWESIPEKGPVRMEKWKKDKKLYYHGSHFTSEKGKYIWEMKLTEKRRKLTLTLIINDQDEKFIHLFEMEHSSENKIGFVNTKSDFLQNISYTRICNNEIFLEIKGKTGKNSVEDKILFIKKEAKYAI